MDIKAMRLKLGLSQQQLSDAVGIPKARIEKWEVGKGKPKVEDYEVLQNFFFRSENSSCVNGKDKDIDTITAQQDAIAALKETVSVQKDHIELQREKIKMLEEKLKVCREKSKVASTTPQ